MPRYFVFALEKGMTILEAFRNQKDSLALSEIANIAGMNLPSATRYIRTFTDLGYLNCDTKTKRYSLTPKVLSLGFTFLGNLDLRKRLYPYMLKLNQKYEVNVNLAILQDVDVVFVERIVGSSLSNLDHRIGTRLPAFCTSLGLSILAFMDPQQALEVIERSKIQCFTPHTITDKTVILELIEQTRQQRYCEVKEQTALGWHNISVPIIMGDQVEGALGISFPIDFFDNSNREKTIVQDLIQIGKSCSLLAKSSDS